MVDPVTGQETKKHSWGGQYPGNRRPQHGPYIPPANDFDKNGTATAHFVTCGGGNALTLVRKDGTTTPETGGIQPEFVEGTFVCV